MQPILLMKYHSFLRDTKREINTWGNHSFIVNQFLEIYLGNVAFCFICSLYNTVCWPANTEFPSFEHRLRNGKKRLRECGAL